MSRLPLVHIPHGIYSVVSKCNNDEFHFDAHEKFELYLRHLWYWKQRLGFRMLDICCMSNHTHEMYVVPEHVTIATILQQVKGQFSRRFNEQFGRSGHFWRNKPFYRIVEDERYALASCHYFHSNPVRAGIVDHPVQWPFSGYRFHLLGDRTGILGKLLDPIPGFTNDTWESCNLSRRDIHTTVKLLQQHRSRFIGSKLFCEHMKRAYNTKREASPPITIC